MLRITTLTYKTSNYIYLITEVYMLQILNIVKMG